METEKKKNRRELLTKKPFYRINADVGPKEDFARAQLGEQPVTMDNLVYDIVTQEDFLRELDPNAHAINDPNVYQNWVQRDEDGLYYETEWERHAFAFQQEILEDRLVRLTGNDIQFDLSKREEDDNDRETFYKFKATWAEKSMERAWYELAKSVLATGDGAFVGILDKGKFYWKVFSFMKGDTLYPHYDRKTGRLAVLARTYTEFGEDGDSHQYIDVWDDTYYYRLIDYSPNTDVSRNPVDAKEEDEEVVIGDFKVTGYVVEEREKHGFDKIPVSYMRKDSGPCWSNSQEAVEHYELAFSRLAQSNSAFGLPILALTNGNGGGKNIEELTMGDMSYAAKIFLIPSEGKAEFLQRQDASNAYKSQLEELKKKIYEMSMVVKAPELKSGDTPAAAIKLLYSDSYNKAMNESQEFDGCIDGIVEIFLWGAGIEKEMRLQFMNIGMSHWCIPYIPINESEMCQNLALGVQNGFLSKETASERNPYSTATEKTRLDKEKHEEQMRELLLEEQRLGIQTDAAIEQSEAQAEIDTDAQIDIINAETQAEDDGDETKKVTAKKRNVRTGRGAGRPRTVGTDKWGNRANEDNWDKWNTSH